MDGKKMNQVPKIQQEQTEVQAGLAKRKRQKDGGKKMNADAIHGRDCSTGFWVVPA